MTVGRVLPEPVEGWPRPVEKVEVARVSRRGDTYAVDRVWVYMLGHWEFAGHVFGRPEGNSERRWWTYKTGKDEPTEFARYNYQTDRRQTAVGALIEAAQRERKFER